MEKGLLDLAILIEPIEIEKYEKIVLPRKETWGFLTSADSYLAHKEEITPEDIKGVPLLISKRPEVQQM
ncbi:LysR family transcriptional regulator, partial [Acinetobacter baumannii]